MKKTILILIFGLIFGVIYKVMEIAKDIESKNSTLKITYIATKPCDLQKRTCHFELPEHGDLSLSILPRPIAQNEELTLKVINSTNISFEKIAIDFFGEDLDMGYNRPLLKEIEDRKYTGKTILPSCAKELMSWKATVIAKTKDETYGFIFRFKTENINE